MNNNKPIPENKDEVKFPIVGAEKCPHCGSTERIGRQYIDGLIAKGHLMKGSYPKGFAFQVPMNGTLIAPLTIKPEIPVVNVYWDICKGCQSLLVSSVEITNVQVNMQQQMPPPGRMS